MSEKFERQKRLCEFMGHLMPESTSKYCLYPDPEALIEDAITLADKLIDTYKNTAWKLAKTSDGEYLGAIKTPEDIIVASDTPARALTLAVDKFLEKDLSNWEKRETDNDEIDN